MSALVTRMTLSSVLKKILVVAGLAVILKAVRFSGVNGTLAEDYLRAEETDNIFKSTHANGGWDLPDTETLQRLYTSKCNVMRISVKDLDPERFEKEFRYKTPVIVTFPNGAADWTWPEVWSQSYLRKNYGQKKTSSGVSQSIAVTGYGSEVHSFTEFTDRRMRQTKDTEESSYVWDRGFYKEAAISSSLTLPPYFAERYHVDENGTFFLGATGTGVAFHDHSDARCAVVFGMKRWFLYPANRYPPGGRGINSMEWYEHIYLSQKLTEEEKPIECVQEAGEIFYIPEGYWHAVINIGDTIGMTLLARESVTVAQKLRLQHVVRANEVKHKQQSGTDLTKGDLRAFYSGMRKLHRIFPDNALYMEHLAIGYEKAGQRQKGIGLLLKAIDADPYCHLAYIALSQIMIELNRLKEAEEFLLQVRDRIPGLWSLHATYGSFLVNMGRYAEAVSVWKRVTTIKSAMLEVWQELRRAQELSGDIEGAKATRHTIRQMIENKKANQE